MTCLPLPPHPAHPESLLPSYQRSRSPLHQKVQTLNKGKQRSKKNYKTLFQNFSCKQAKQMIYLQVLSPNSSSYWFCSVFINHSVQDHIRIHKLSSQQVKTYDLKNQMEAKKKKTLLNRRMKEWLLFFNSTEWQVEWTRTCPE
jgi:hypothetical protein